MGFWIDQSFIINPNALYMNNEDQVRPGFHYMNDIGFLRLRHHHYSVYNQDASTTEWLVVWQINFSITSAIFQPLTPYHRGHWRSNDPTCFTQICLNNSIVSLFMCDGISHLVRSVPIMRGEYNGVYVSTVICWYGPLPITLHMHKNSLWILSFCSALHVLKF